MNLFQRALFLALPSVPADLVLQVDLAFQEILETLVYHVFPFVHLDLSALVDPVNRADLKLSNRNFLFTNKIRKQICWNMKKIPYL